MAKIKRKGKSKQKKTVVKDVVTPATAQSVEIAESVENADATVEQTEVKDQTAPKSAKLQAKELKAQQKAQAQLDKEKAQKLKNEQREKSGKVGVGRRLKETGSELKKVSWPTFKEVCKKTGVVIAVVIFFGIALVAFDYLLSLLYNLFIGGLNN